jgi:hypothetical protein
MAVYLARSQILGITIITIWKKSNHTSMWRMEPQRGRELVVIVRKPLHELTKP